MSQIGFDKTSACSEQKTLFKVVDFQRGNWFEK